MQVERRQWSVCSITDFIIPSATKRPVNTSRDSSCSRSCLLFILLRSKRPAIEITGTYFRAQAAQRRLIAPRFMATIAQRRLTIARTGAAMSTDKTSGSTRRTDCRAGERAADHRGVNDVTATHRLDGSATHRESYAHRRNNGAIQVHSGTPWLCRERMHLFWLTPCVLRLLIVIYLRRKPPLCRATLPAAAQSGAFRRRGPISCCHGRERHRARITRRSNGAERRLRKNFGARIANLSIGGHCHPVHFYTPEEVKRSPGASSSLFASSPPLPRKLSGNWINNAR